MAPCMFFRTGPIPEVCGVPAERVGRIEIELVRYVLVDLYLCLEHRIALQPKWLRLQPRQRDHWSAESGA